MTERVLARQWIRALCLGAALTVATGTVTVTGPTAAHADTSTVATVADKSGDVRLLARKGLTRAERRSIDLRKVTLQRVDQSARFTFAIRDLMRTRKFDQMVFVSWNESPDTPNPWMGYLSLGVNSTYASASYSSPDGQNYENCTPPIAIRPRRNEIVVTVPWRCVPEGPLKIKVTTETGRYRSDEAPYSRDAATFPGWPTVLPI